MWGEPSRLARAKGSPHSTWTSALLVLLAWGALAFGAVYPWAYGTLLSAAVSLGAWGLLARAGGDVERWLPKALLAGLALVAAGATVQLVPIDRATLARVSPAAHFVIGVDDMAYGTGVEQRHALSIAPHATWLGLAFVGSLAILLFGVVRMLRLQGARTLCLGLIALGTVLALVGIIQKPLYAGRIFGFWQTEFGGSPFGPFVNKNHFAGWMIMALSLSLGYYCGAIASIRRGEKTSFRDRVLWISSPEVSQLLVIGTCLAVMALSLVLTLSRSGITCLTLAVLITGSVAIVKRRQRSHGGIIATYAVFLLVVAVAWTGSEVIAQRFASADWSEFNSRVGASRDAWQIALRFMPFGSGLNTYGTTTRYFQTIEPSAHYVEAHNDYLQLLAEGGLLIALPALLTFAIFVCLVWRRFRTASQSTMTWWMRVGAVTGILAIALQEMVEFSLQIPGNAVLFVILLAVAIHEPLARKF